MSVLVSVIICPFFESELIIFDLSSLPFLISSIKSIGLVEGIGGRGGSIRGTDRGGSIGCIRGTGRGGSNDSTKGNGGGGFKGGAIEPTLSVGTFLFFSYIFWNSK
jgi:hypothetical protein